MAGDYTPLFREIQRWVQEEIAKRLSHAGIVGRTVSGSSISGPVDANARVTVKKAGADVGSRRALNLIEGSGVTLTVEDDPAGEEVEVTIAAEGGTGVTASDLQTFAGMIINAHRGDMNPTDGYPEGTLEGYLQAIRKGCHSCDLDVQRNAEGTWYVMHDATVDRTTNGTGTVASKTNAQMNALVIDGGYGYVAARHAGLYHPPTLAAVLDALRPYHVMVGLDAKGSGEYSLAVEYARGRGWDHRITNEALAVSSPYGAYTEADVRAARPGSYAVWVPVEEYGITDERAVVRTAYERGVWCVTVNDVDGALAEWRELMFLDEHLAAADPHPGYQRESEKNAANGYAGLDATARIATARLGSGAANASSYLRGDRTWQPLVAASSAWSVLTDGSGGAITGDDGDWIMCERVR
jgi:glycerophosphoryl diester phosphodiesterase